MIRVLMWAEPLGGYPPGFDLGVAGFDLVGDGEQIGDLGSLALLRTLFHFPGKLKLSATIAFVSEEAAQRMGQLAAVLEGRGHGRMETVRCLMRLRKIGT